MDENKLKNFLINGFQPKEEREDPDEGSGEERIDEVTDDTVYMVSIQYQHYV